MFSLALPYGRCVTVPTIESVLLFFFVDKVTSEAIVLDQQLSMYGSVLKQGHDLFRIKREKDQGPVLECVELGKPMDRILFQKLFIL